MGRFIFFVVVFLFSNQSEASIAGTWLGQCRIAPMGGSTRSLFVFSKWGPLTRHITFWKSDDCQGTSSNEVASYGRYWMSTLSSPGTVSVDLALGNVVYKQIYWIEGDTLWFGETWAHGDAPRPTKLSEYERWVRVGPE